MNDEQKLELFNRLARVVRPAFTEYKDVTDASTELVDTGLDSLDIVMISIYLGVIYGVPEKQSDKFAPTTVQQMFDLAEQNKTQEPPATVEEAVEMVR